MPRGKKAAAEPTAPAEPAAPADHPPEGAWPGDPSYQAPAAPTREDRDVLEKDTDARAKALQKDLKKMGAR